MVRLTRHEAAEKVHPTCWNSTTTAPFASQNLENHVVVPVVMRYWSSAVVAPAIEWTTFVAQRMVGERLHLRRSKEPQNRMAQRHFLNSGSQKHLDSQTTIAEAATLHVSGPPTGTVLALPRFLRLGGCCHGGCCCWSGGCCCCWSGGCVGPFWFHHEQIQGYSGIICNNSVHRINITSKRITHGSIDHFGIMSVKQRVLCLLDLKLWIVRCDQSLVWCNCLWVFFSASL